MSQSQTMTHRHRVWLLALEILAAVLATVSLFLPQTRVAIARVLELVQAAGPWGPAAMIAVYIVGCVLFVPGSILTLGAGLLFGFWIGLATVSIGSTLGAGAAFLVARTILRDWAIRKSSRYPAFQALDEAAAREGFRIVLLTRLSPVLPFNLLNFAFGVTKVSFRDYMLASWIGMLPGAVLYVYLGTGMKSLAELTSGGPSGGTAEITLFTLGLVATVIVSLLLTRLAKNALQTNSPQATAMSSERKMYG